MKTDETLCIKTVVSGKWPRAHQCTRKRGYGPNGEYCKRHDPAAVKARDEIWRRKYEAEVAERERVYRARAFGEMLIDAGYDTEDKVRVLISDSFLYAKRDKG